MRVVGLIARIFFLVLLLVEAGCGPATTGSPPPGDNSSNLLSTYTAYAPVKIDIMPLTEFISVDNARQANIINLYVSLLNSFGSQIISPCVFRFELYRRVQRSSEPKGRRIKIWEDIDLTDLAANNEYWRDFVRAYEFNLGFEPQSNQSYVLQATCMCPSGRRLSAEFTLKHTK